MFIAVKTEDGEIKGKISFYCRVLHVSRQAFRNYLKNKNAVWKYQPLADAMMDICMEDECNDTYGRIRMYQALQLKQPEGVSIPSERTVYRVMDEIGISHRPKRKPNGITKADKEARKSDDLIKRDFTAEKPLKKCVTDMTEIKAADGKLYVSAIFDCYDLAVLGLAMDTNMKASLCEQTLDNAVKAYPMLMWSLTLRRKVASGSAGLRRNFEFPLRSSLLRRRRVPSSSKIVCSLKSLIKSWYSLVSSNSPSHSVSKVSPSLMTVFIRSDVSCLRL